MKRSTYRDRDYSFGQAMLTLRVALSLTQQALADYLHVSRRAVGEWEAGSKYPKPEHLKAFIALALEHNVFPQGQEAERSRALWKQAHQRVLFDEVWFATLFQPEYVVAEPVPIRQRERVGFPASLRVNDLPLQATRFIGRADERAEIARLLNDPSCRLLTLIGPGGIGKTRLALQVAADQAANYADGVVFVSLASVGSASQIAATISEHLALSLSGQPDVEAYLLAALRQRHLLLVLDNFEHLLDGVDLINNILYQAPQVTLLVTSWVRLNLQAEWLFDVEGLAFPALAMNLPKPTEPPSNLLDFSAIQLFVQRAMQVQPYLTLSPVVLQSVANICEYVAGMPLAIELAAVNARMLPIPEIEQQIRSNLDVLETNFRDMPQRHRSLRAVFDHSWARLSESERTLLSRLSVFRGGCTIEAIQRVAGAKLLDLYALMDKSLLTDDPNYPKSKTGSERRFILLETIRAYALEKLTQRGETERLRRAHADYYLAFIESVVEHWHEPNDESPIERIEHDYNNIRAALQWTRDSGHSTLGLKMAGILWHFWRSGGYISEGRVWCDELLALDDANAVHNPEHQPDPDALRIRLQAIEWAALMATDQHDFAHASELFEQSIALHRALGKAGSPISLRITAALEARDVGHYQQAQKLLEDALAELRSVNDRGTLASGGIGFVLYMLAIIYRERGNFARAAALLEEVIDQHNEIGDREGSAQGLLGLSDIARDQGDIGQLRTYCEQSLTIYYEYGTQWAIAFAFNNLAQAAFWSGDLDRALELVNDSITIFREQNAGASLTEPLITLGHILQVQGDNAGASAALREALRLAWQVGPRVMFASALEALAGMLVQIDQVELAARLLAASAWLREEMGAPIRPIDQSFVDEAVANALLKLGSAAFTAIWQESRSQPLEQLVAELRLEPAAELVTMPAPLSAPPAPISVSGRKRLNWDRAPSVFGFYGRDWESNLLESWVVDERCHVVSIFGFGGIGKTALAVNLMHRIAPQFEVVVWRSLRDVPTYEVLVEELLQVLDPRLPGEVSAGTEPPLDTLFRLLRSARILIVLDNVEFALREGENAGRMRPEFRGFGQFLRQSVLMEHQSCVVLTSREKLSDLVPLEGSYAPVRALRLASLDAAACEALLTEKAISGSAEERAALIETYAGNPLALKIVAQTLFELFGGAITPLLEQGEVVFGGVRDLLTEQIEHLPALEQQVLYWLAILREAATLDDLVTLFVTSVARPRMLEALERLYRRSLIERSQKQGNFTLQPVVLEYLTTRLIETVVDEVQRGEFSRLIEHGIVLAHARDDVREAQERSIVIPVLERLRLLFPQQAALEARLTALLGQLAAQPEVRQGYAPATLRTLLRLLRDHTSGLDALVD